MDKTINYYNENATQFAQSTIGVDFLAIQTRFERKLPGSKDTKILDFGCGSGRDTKYFLNRGYQVDATDGSRELCKLASEYTGIKVKNCLFQDLNAVNEYDGIWACSSILHLRKEELKSVIRKVAAALKPKGVFYTSFKYGDFEGYRNGRYFTDFTLEGFRDLMAELGELDIEEYWITGDARPDRGNERWLNLILRKK